MHILSFPAKSKKIILKCMVPYSNGLRAYLVSGLLKIGNNPRQPVHSFVDLLFRSS
jgi:hypothetical protein